jgi:hypothetical protein
VFGGLNQEMGNTTIVVRLLGEVVDCWRPVDGIDQGQASYLIGAPADEYAPEVRTILPRLPVATGVGNVTAILHEEFSRWFGADTAGSRQAYEVAASRIWEAVRRYRYAG